MALGLFSRLEAPGYPSVLYGSTFRKRMRCSRDQPPPSLSLRPSSPSSHHPSSWTHKQTPHHSWICEKMQIYLGNRLGILNPNPSSHTS